MYQDAKEEGMIMNHNPKLNTSGLPDPTAYAACHPISKEEQRVSDLVHVLRYVARGAGFDIINRIEFRERESGRTYR